MARGETIQLTTASLFLWITELRFDAISLNSMDATSDRDFVGMSF